MNCTIFGTRNSAMSRWKAMSRLAVVALAAGAVLAACGAPAAVAPSPGGPSSVATVASTPAAVALATPTPAPTSGPPSGCLAFPPELAGRWSHTILASDLTPEVIDNRTGKLVMTLGPGTSVSINFSGSEIDAPWACVIGDRLLMSEERGPGACTHLGQLSYKWQIKADQLVLTNIDDQCIARAFSNTVHPWDREP